MTFPTVGVQSWSLRHFSSIDSLLPQVRALGLDRLELCGVQCNFDDPAAHAPVIGAAQAAGVAIGSIGVQTFQCREAVEREWFAFARAAGTEVITCHFKVDSFTQAVPLAVRLAEEYDVRLAIHCHGGYLFGGSVDVLDHLLALGGPRLGVCIDTAWCLQAGGDPLAWVRRWPGRIHGVHFKDFVFTPQGKWQEKPVGLGTLDVDGFVQALVDTGFSGTAVVEYEADLEAPQGAIRASLARVAAAVAKAGG